MAPARRTRLTLAAATLAIALLAAPGALGHATVSPAFLASGEEGELRLEAPNERDEPMTALAVRLPAGLEAAAGQPETPGWQLEADGPRVVWTGGPAAGGEVVLFRLRARASGEPGPVTIEVEQRYASGAVVRWSPPFTVLPAAGDAPRQYLGRALVAAAAGLVVVGGSLVVARRLRRRRPAKEGL